jgi:hypothetical protein
MPLRMTVSKGTSPTIVILAYDSFSDDCDSEGSHAASAPLTLAQCTVDDVAVRHAVSEPAADTNLVNTVDGVNLTSKGEYRATVSASTALSLSTCAVNQCHSHSHGGAHDHSNNGTRVHDPRTSTTAKVVGPITFASMRIRELENTAAPEPPLFS